MVIGAGQAKDETCVHGKPTQLDFLLPFLQRKLQEFRKSFNSDSVRDDPSHSSALNDNKTIFKNLSLIFLADQNVKSLIW